MIHPINHRCSTEIKERTACISCHRGISGEDKDIIAVIWRISVGPCQRTTSCLDIIENHSEVLVGVKFNPIRLIGKVHILELECHVI